VVLKKGSQGNNLYSSLGFPVFFETLQSDQKEGPDK
jgi:hypothetical protein